MVENTCGGDNAMMCHGAGPKLKTVSDLVYAIEIVDANGIIREYTMAEHGDDIRAYGGSMGMFGPIISMTYRLPRLTMVDFHPFFQDYELAVPRPENVTGDLTTLTSCFNSVYTELYWSVPNKPKEEERRWGREERQVFICLPFWFFFFSLFFFPRLLVFCFYFLLNQVPWQDGAQPDGLGQLLEPQRYARRPRCPGIVSSPTDLLA